MPKKNRRQNHNQGSAPYIHNKRSALTAAQKQTVTVPCRQVVNIKFGQTA